MPDLSPADRDLITKTVLGEAGDQPEEGQAAVAHVIRNRLNTQTGEFGDNTSIPAVVLGRNAFEAWSGDNRARTARASSKSGAYKGAASIVDDVFSGKTPDPTNGATYFYSPKDQAALHRPAPPFARTMPSHGAIGDHQFYSSTGPRDALSAINAAIGESPIKAMAYDDEPSIFESAGFKVPKAAAPDAGGAERSIFEAAGFKLPQAKAQPEAPAGLPPGAAGMVTVPGGVPSYVDRSGKFIDMPGTNAPAASLGERAIEYGREIGGQYTNALSRAFGESRGMVGSGGADLRNSMPAAGVGKMGLGFLGMLTSPVTGALDVAGQEVDKATGVPGTGERAAIVAGGLGGAPRALTTAARALPGARGVNALVQRPSARKTCQRPSHGCGRTRS
jgi:hypothetical protein